MNRRKNIIYRVHALRRMFERDISRKEVLDVLRHGERIEDYPEALSELPPARDARRALDTRRCSGVRERPVRYQRLRARQSALGTRFQNTSMNTPPEERRCVVCKSGLLRPGETTVTLQRGPTTLVIKNVPALVCETCSESYVDDETAQRLLERAEEAAEGGVEVDVRRYVAA